MTRKKASTVKKSHLFREVDKSHPAIENLRERLSSPRLKSPGTILTYTLTAARFLSWQGGENTPTDSDFRRYFMMRREGNISERTLRKEFFQLKKLALANDWSWPFTGDDAPMPDEEANQPVLLTDQIKHLINIQKQLSKAERFFLAVSTTWGCRREEMSRIKKRDYDGETLTIHTAKHGRKVKHLIPDALKPIFETYRFRPHTTKALTPMFRRITTKAGLDLPSGYGWHSIRRMVVTMLAALLPKNSLDPALLADYMGWSKSSLGPLYGGAAMVSFYRHPEVLDTDPYGGDRLIYGVHPFLSLWPKKRLPKPAVQEEPALSR